MISTPFLFFGQKSVKFSGGFLENLKNSKRHSEIIWPLGGLHVSKLLAVWSRDLFQAEREVTAYKPEQIDNYFHSKWS